MLRPKELVSRWINTFTNVDVPSLIALYDDNATNHQVANAPVIGIWAIEEMFINEFATAKMVTIVGNIFDDGQWSF